MQKRGIEMRLCCRLPIITILFITTFLDVSAQMFPRPGNDPEPGWQTNVELGLIYFDSTGQNQDQIDSYDEDPERTTRLLPWPSIQVRYNDTNDTGNWFFGNRRGSMTVGRMQNTPVGRFSLDFGVNLFTLFDIDLPGRDFENPYQLGETREKTSRDQSSQSFQYAIGRQVGLSLSYRRDNWKLENDKTTELDPALGRNGYKDTSSSVLKVWFLQGGYDQITAKTEGEADSYSGHQQFIGVGIPLFIKGLIMNLRSGNGELEYDAVHPLFNKTRKDETSSSNLIVMWKKDDFGVRFMLTNAVSDSNIDFFDTNTLFTSFGFNWDF